jgi:hypothetical protein
MKMKKVQLGFSILAVSALLVLGCNKKDNIAPEPDTEFESAVDVTWANMVITDLDQICAFVGENDMYPKFYQAAPGQSTITVTRDTVAKYLFVSFNKTKCLDGRLRDGTILMNYKHNGGDPNARYYHDYGFEGNVQLANYKIDGWLIKQTNTFFVRNKVEPIDWKPQNGIKLTWQLTGEFIMVHPTDTTKNIQIYCDYTKVLLGTSNPSIFPVSKQAAINWTMSTIAYKGTSFGKIGTTEFKFEFIDKESSPVIRDFTCYPDKVVGISVGTATNSSAPVVTPRFEEYHPFIGGAANFTTSTLYPRVIHYGSETAGVANQCDDEGVVTIKGISYPVNFVKENK